MLVLESRSCHRSKHIQRTLTAVSGRLGYEDQVPSDERRSRRPSEHSARIGTTLLVHPSRPVVFSSRPASSSMVSPTARGVRMYSAASTRALRMESMNCHSGSGRYCTRSCCHV
ncbi:hypothetical protein SynWH8103_01484 [Synechococcus sp. WH 8103]|nr:hypothetical protein SynWH8103_01484 [Synechococcus sp. WH 8103]